MFGRVGTALASRNADVLPGVTTGGGISVLQRGHAINSSNTYEQHAREAYQKSELIFAGIENLCTSAAEPKIVGHRALKAKRLRNLTAFDDLSYVERFNKIIEMEKREDGVYVAARWLKDQGVSPARINRFVINAGILEEVTDHPAIELFNHPNPFMSRFDMVATLIMDRYLAGNSYLWKQRPDGIGGSGKPVGLWRLRPDRLTALPRDDGLGIDSWVYRTGSTEFPIPAADIIHFKTRNPLSGIYGMPPLMALTGRNSIDNYMRSFVEAFFANAGVPGGVLSFKAKMSQQAKDDLREQLRGTLNGPSGWHDWLILDQTESAFQPTTMSLGQRGLIVPELDAITEARIGMVLQIPAGILMSRLGQERANYAQMREEENWYWSGTLAPLYKALSDTINLFLTPEYPDLDELLFDLSDVRALQDDVDKLHARARSDLDAGGLMVEEFRLIIGLDPSPAKGHFLLPTRSTLVPAPLADITQPEAPPPLAEPAKMLAAGFTSMFRAMLPEPEPAPAAAVTEVVAEAHCPSCGRWVGRNLNAGATVYCPKCKEVEITA